MQGFTVNLKYYLTRCCKNTIHHQLPSGFDSGLVITLISIFTEELSLRREGGHFTEEKTCMLAMLSLKASTPLLSFKCPGQ